MRVRLRGSRATADTVGDFSFIHPRIFYSITSKASLAATTFNKQLPHPGSENNFGRVGKEQENLYLFIGEAKGEKNK